MRKYRTVRLITGTVIAGTLLFAAYWIHVTKEPFREPQIKYATLDPHCRLYVQTERKPETDYFVYPWKKKHH